MGVRLYHILIGLLFIASPIVIFLVRPDFGFELYDLAKSVLITAYCLSLYFLGARFWNSEDPVRNFSIEPLFVWIIVPTFVVVLFSLLSIDLEVLKISREVERDNRLLLFLVNLNVISGVLAILYCFHRPHLFSVLLLVLAIGLSTFISYLEGRRAIVIILCGLSTFLLVFSQKTQARRAAALIAGLAITIALTYIVTTSRTGQTEGDPLLLLQGIVTRSFNPGWIILEVTSMRGFSFQPEVFTYMADRFLYILGITDFYRGVGNDFGVHYGFLQASNYVVGINPGILVEFYLSAGIWAPIPIAIILSIGRLIIEASGRYSAYLPSVVALLICHGLQMEIGYTFGLMIRLLALLALLKLSVMFISRRTWPRFST